MRISAKLGLVFFIVIMLLMCWEYQKTNAALVDASIPEQSIRLRILANSDRPQDQLLKRQVRDMVVANMNTWAKDAEHIDEARAEVENRLPDFERIVGEVLEEQGFDYSYSVEFGMVDFPTKIYGNQMYPAGDYEALLITIGEGVGLNWWCVLFPPLCFVEIGVGDAGNTTGLEQGGKSSIDSLGKALDEMTEDGPQEKEVRFFLFELIEKLIEWIKSFWK